MADEPAKASTEKAKPAPAPAPAERWEPLASLRAEVDRLFDDFTFGWPVGRFAPRSRSLLSPFRDWSLATPAVDIVDLDNEIQMRAELPGIDEKDLAIEISGDLVTIRGEKKEETEKGEKEGRYYLSERRYGSFQRSLNIPEGADADKAEARFAKGVLTLSFPKTKAAREKVKKVKIKSE